MPSKTPGARGDGEGASLVDGNENNVTLTECSQQMLCVCHSRNTCNKDIFLDKVCPDADLQGMKLDILKDLMKEEVESGYENLAEFSSPPQEIPSAS